MPVIAPPIPQCKCKKLRTPRKIHAACGLLLTAFLAVHLGIGISGLDSVAYQQNVDLLHSVLRVIPGFTIAGVLLPLLIQCAMGLFLVNK